LGAEVPFLRPAELAQDLSVDLPLFTHALSWLKEHENYRPDVIIQLRPTSPIRPVELVDGAIQLLLDHPEAHSVRGVIPSGQNPHKMWQIEKDGCMKPLLPIDGVSEPFNAPRQELPQTYWQTGHIDAIRTSTVLDLNSLSGTVILPYIIDPAFTVDIDSLRDWSRAEWLVLNAGLNMVFPGRKPRPLPEKVRLVVMDFDGVLTDNRVWVDETGKETVAAYRSDSLGLAILRQKTGIDSLVLSMETNPVVSARCKKMKVPVLQGVNQKDIELKQFLASKGIDPTDVIYVGNDVNDLVCFNLVGCAIVPVDAEPDVLKQADIVLTRRGGHGAVRELCDILIEKFNGK